MIIQHIAEAYEAIALALKYAQKRSDMFDTLQSAREALRKALDEIKAEQADDRKFYDAILKYSLARKAELGDAITDIKVYQQQDR